MKVRLVYLGPARDWAGMDGETVEVANGATVDEVADGLWKRLSGLGERRAVLRFAVNQVFAEKNQVLSEGDEVAIIPPVSGGEDVGDDWIAIVDEPIDREAIRCHVDGDNRSGGISIFEGVTRFERDEKYGGLLRLEYEAYGEMAISEMRCLIAEARERWPILRSAVVHRVGSVGIGEASVIIAVACGHRAESFEACRWLIDALKQDVPIWKKEIWESGESSWVDPTACKKG